MSSMMFFSKSWVMGRENLIFSSSLAMAVASSKPIQMGTALSDATSLRIMMGLLVKGSMVNPETVISLSMMPPLAMSSGVPFHGYAVAELSTHRPFREWG